MRKRILMLVLAVTMFAVGIFTPLAEMTGFSVKSGAAVPDFYDYKADYIKNEGYYCDFVTNLDIPYKGYVMKLESSNAFMKSMDA